jgi:hypothetical protein
LNRSIDKREKEKTIYEAVIRSRKCKITVDFVFRSFIYGLIEREKLITNIYILFRFDDYLAEKNGKKVE